jgi:methionine-rich copper-binding protein CopC
MTVKAPVRVAVGVVAVLAALTAAAVLSGALSRPSDGTVASARLVSSTPADNAVLGSAPAAIALTFSAPLDAGSSHVGVRSATGSAVNAGPAGRAGADTLRQPVAITAPGGYTVAYHVVFTGGGELLGVVHFSVGPAGPAQAAAVGPAQAAAGPAQAAAVLSDGHDHGVDPVGGVLLLADVVVLVTVVVMLVASRRRGYR